MLIAIATGGDGRRVLVLGLEEENVRRLVNDQPIRKRLDVVGGAADFENWDLAILGPEDTVRFVSAYPPHSEQLTALLTAADRYVVSDGRLTEIRAMLDGDAPARDATASRLAGAVYDLLAERDDRDG